VPTVSAGAEEVPFLFAAVRRAVARSSIRAVAKDSEVSHGGISNIVSGKTRRLYGTTLTKLRSWYLRQWAAGGDGLTPDVAAYLMGEMLAAIAPGERNAAALELVHALERIYTTHGGPRPAWLSVVRDEYQGTGTQSVVER
jgi:hypothetical protein